MALTLPDFNKTVSNIPYQISSGITFRLLGMGFEFGIITYQYEFARRMVAKPGTPEYGRLSVAAQYFADVEILETVPRNAFTPQPDVKSAVVRLTPRPPQYWVENPDFFLDFIRAAFSQRRKKLRNAILNSRMPGIDQASISALDTALLEKRAEALAPSELAALSDELFRLSRREALRPSAPHRL